MDYEQQSSFHAILGRALTDSAFRDDLISGDEGRQTQALMQAGVGDPTPEMFAAINNAARALENLAGQFRPPVEAS